MRKNLRNRVLATSLVAMFSFLVVTCCAPLFAQTLTTGAISGTVTDPTGAVVPNATITVTSITTGAVRTTHSGTNGQFTLPQLNPGEYRVKVAAEGFR